MRWSVETAHGVVPVEDDEAGSSTVVLLAHGAGGHMAHKTILWLAELLRGTGLGVVRFNFVYRAQGRAMPDRMPVLVETYRSVIASVRERLNPKRLIIGGHSMGGRVASMLEAERPTADGLVLFGYPLHPAGQPEKLRTAHLPAIRVPVLQLSGTEDALCREDIMLTVAAGLDSKIWTLKWIEGADHSYSVKKSSGRSRIDVETDIRRALSSWLSITQ